MIHYSGNPSEIKFIEDHYVRTDIIAAIISALGDAGKDLKRLKPEDIARIDEFHVGGLEATRELAGQLGLEPRHTVLDVGSGIGGAARFIAAAFGCRITGLDLVDQYCEAAETLTRLVGLGNQVDFRQGDALDMPFPDASFDVVWTQHASMNIPDKPGLYAEICRVLRPGGLFAMYDVLAGAGGPPYFPVPWAENPSISHLISPEKLRQVMEDAGFLVRSWRDRSEQGREWFRMAAERKPLEGDAKLGLHVLMGPQIRLMSRNLIRNLDEGRVVLLEAIAGRKPE